MAYHQPQQRKLRSRSEEPGRSRPGKEIDRKSRCASHNFRPGIMEKIGLGYPEVKKLNARIIYGAVSGYGKEGPWKNRPGQDLLLQSMSGLAYTTGNAKDNPMPFGLAIA